MSDAAGELETLIAGLGELSQHGKVLAEIARALAEDVDDPPTNDKGVPQSRSAPARALQGVVAELIVKGRVDADDDSGADDWASFASGAGATPIRHEAKPGAGDARARGRRGRSSA